MKKKTHIFVMPITVLAICLTACSQKNKKETYGEYGKGSSDILQEEIKIDERADSVYFLGEIVEAFELRGEAVPHHILNYELTDAKLYSSPEEAAIQRDQMVNASFYNLPSGDGEIVYKDVAEFSLLVCDINIKNIDAEYLNIAALSLIYMEPDSRETKCITDPCYFSKSISIAEPDNSDYFHYELSKGDSMDAKVAWAVDTDVYDKNNFYRCTSYGGDESVVKYIKLDL